MGNTRRAGLSEEEIRRIIAAEAVKAIGEVTLELLRMVKTTITEFFDDRYATLYEVLLLL